MRDWFGRTATKFTKATTMLLLGSLNRSENKQAVEVKKKKKKKKKK